MGTMSGPIETLVIHPGALGDQEESDVAPAHVRSGPERGLPVASTPVARRVDERRLAPQQVTDAIEIAVGLADENLDDRRVEPLGGTQWRGTY